MARAPILTRENVPEQFPEAFDHETANSGGVVASGRPAKTLADASSKKLSQNRGQSTASPFRNEESCTSPLSQKRDFSPRRANSWGFEIVT